MKQQIALAAAVVVLGLAPCGPLHAQAMQPAYPGYLFGGLPPYEIVAIVRSKGLEPLSRPVRQGPAYTLRAVDQAGRMVHVIVDARMGRIVRVVPTNRADAAGAPPYPIPPAPDRDVPDGNGANSRIAGVPPYPSEDFEPIEQGPASGGIAGYTAPRPTARALPPPLPRPRPKMESTADSAASASADATPPFTELDE